MKKGENNGLFLSGIFQPIVDLMSTFNYAFQLTQMIGYQATVWLLSFFNNRY